MKKITVLALRNVFRNSRRSIITGMAIFFGVFVLINGTSYIEGLYRGMERTVISNGIGHIQIHKKGYIKAIEDRTVSGDLVIHESSLDKILKPLNKEIKYVSKRIVFSGIAKNDINSTTAFGVGANSEIEKHFLKNLSILKGRYLKQGDIKGVLINERLMRVLKVKPGDSINITTQTAKGSMNNLQYLVVGVFDPGVEFSGFRATPEIYMNLKSAKLLLDSGDNITEVVLELKDQEHTRFVESKLAAEVKKNSLDIEIHNWQYLGQKLLEIASYIKYGIRGWTVILFAVILLTILNTFLMSVYERTYEVGLLKAIGVKRRRILSLFFLEAVFLSLLSVAIALVVSFISVSILARVGLPGMFNFLIKGELVRPAINWIDVMIVTISAVVISSIAGLYPAIKASQMDPIDALRYE